jgi:hypothetical protein
MWCLRLQRPDEVVVAAKQLHVIFETLVHSRVVDRPPKKIGEPGRIVRFSRSTKEVFSFEESSESRSVSSNRHASPISILRSTLMMRSFLRVFDHLAVNAGTDRFNLSLK